MTTKEGERVDHYVTLRACLGLPACTSTLGTCAEAYDTPVVAILMLETLRFNLRHVTKHIN